MISPPSCGGLARPLTSRGPIAIDTTRRISLTGHALRLPDVFAWTDAVCREFGGGVDLSSRLRLLLEEILTNIRAHGYGPGRDGGIEVVCARGGDGSVTLEVTDAAPPFDPLTEAPEPSLADDLAARAIGGLGIHLVKSLTVEQRYRYENGRNILTLVIKSDDWM